jgi:peptidoglycan/xylan/chitin deacetylase (PgdA/CDA1 family)
MRSLSALALLAIALSVAASGPAAADECSNPNALGVRRTLVVDPAAMPQVGTMSYHDSLPLEDHEVVLTFDDGPLPPHTEHVLEILASECVKATYFMVGEMAVAHPEWVRKVAEAGHTIGTHSFSHPLTFHRMPIDKAQEQIDKGFEAVQKALGSDYKVAPFFRYPGLLHQANSEAYLAERGIIAWSADFPGDDWKRRISAKEVVKRSLSRLEARGRGILLLHDIHKVTVAALPTLLAELKARGFKVVHVVPGPLPAEPLVADGVPQAVANPSLAAALKPLAAVATMAKIAPEISDNAPDAHAAVAQKSLAALTEVPVPPARPKAASSEGARAHVHRTARGHARARLVHGPARAAMAQTRHAQRSHVPQTTGGARDGRACANCRVIRVKKAHLGAARSG